MDVLILFCCSFFYFLNTRVFSHSLEIPTVMTTLLGTALAFFVGFNNNQAYDRWWEARIIWGALVNDSRSFSRYLLNNMEQGNLSDEEYFALQNKMVKRHIAFIYSLKSRLRKTEDTDYKKYISSTDAQYVQSWDHTPNALLELQARDLAELKKNACIDSIAHYHLQQMLTFFTDHLGKSERIAGTVFPVMYIFFTKIFIWVLVIFVQLNFTDRFGFWSVIISSVIGFIFHITHQNGMSLMNPFVNEPSGIALNQITRNIERNLLEMLGYAQKDLPEHEPIIDQEYVM